MAQRKSYDGIARFFDFLRSGDMLRFRDAQKNLFSRMRGKVLHVGIGTGLEIANFPPGLDITSIDLSPQMLERARERAAGYPGTLRLCLMNAQNLGFPDNTFDTVVTVCVLCSVPDPVPSLIELRRALKPNGNLLMFEHVLSKNPLYGLVLRFMSLFTTTLEGTHLDRNTVANAMKAGFTLQSEENVYLDIVKSVVVSK